MKHPEISIVVPVYGVEKLIERCADSLFGQMYDNIQFIFVNDGTKDRSMEILASLIDRKYAHLKDRTIIVNKENGGLSSARKAGLEYVKGDYVWNVDADDYVENDAAEKIAHAIECSGADMVFFNYVRHRNGKAKKLCFGAYSGMEPRELAGQMFLGHFSRNVWSKCIRTDIFRKNDIRFSPEDMGEDFFLNTQVLNYCRSVYYLDEYLYHYDGENVSSMTFDRYNPEKKAEECVNLMSLYDMYRDNLDNSPIRDSVHYILYRIGYYIWKCNLNIADMYPAAIDYILEAGYRPKSSGGVTLLRQFVLRRHFRKTRRKKQKRN